MPPAKTIRWEPLAAIAKAVGSGQITAEGLVKCALKEIAAYQSLHAVLEINPQALKQAQMLDASIKNGQKAGRLAGVPFIAKDNFLTHNTSTTAASKILEGFKAPYQATAVNRLEAEGAILVAKANLDEFAHGSSTENSAFGATKNPHNTDYVPGGSSGGSAAAVAAGLVPLALGTDTGGSIRLPASFTGTVGFKPTYGLISRFGVIAMGSSVDVIGPITNNTEDAALALEVMAGADGFDSTLIRRDSGDYSQLQPNLKGKKFGLIKEHMGKDADSKVSSKIKEVISSIKEAGAEVEEISIPVDELALAVYYIVVPAEISSNLARYDGIKYGFSAKTAKNLEEQYKTTRQAGFGDEPKRRILMGTYVLSSGYYDAYYKKAQAVRTQLIEQYAQVFKKFDYLMGPTSPTPPFKLGERQDPLSMYLADVATVATNLIGSPAISLPVGKAGGLPVGLQLIGPQRSDKEMLETANAIEKLGVGNV